MIPKPLPQQPLLVVLLLATVPCFIAAPRKRDLDWIDPATPEEAQTILGMNNRTLSLVFSDEFFDESRSFHDGADTRWTSEDRPGVTNAGLQYYNSSHVLTRAGELVIQTSRRDATWTEYDPHNGYEMEYSRFYQSGMLTTWNKFCFTSGVIEISFQLPGAALRGGLWPAFWMLGNLVRPNYLESSNGVWPYSYDECGNSTEAREVQLAQKMNKCQNGTGRGSPEIDIIEAQPGDFTLHYHNVKYADNSTKLLYTVGRPLMSSSLQVSPGVHKSRRPTSPNMPEDGQWYPELYPMGGPAYDYEGLDTRTRPPRMINNYWYGQPINLEPEVWQDGLSCNWNHDPSFYEEQTILRTEWQTGKDDGYVRWYYGDELIYEVTADMLKQKPGAGDAIPQIPFEAMYLILNTDVSPRWGWNGCNPNDPCLAVTGLCSVHGELTCMDCANPDCLRCPDSTAWFADFCEDVHPERPAEFKIDFVRVYQDLTDPTHSLGCNPPEYPTKDIIEQDWEKYTFNSWVKKEPLKMVQHGGAPCTTQADCGNVLASEQVLTNFRSPQEGKTPTYYGDGGTSSTPNQEKTAYFGSEDLDNFVEELSTLPGRESYCIQGRCSCPDFKWTGPSCQSPCVGDYAYCQPTSGGASWFLFTYHSLTTIQTSSYGGWMSLFLRVLGSSIVLVSFVFVLM